MHYGNLLLVAGHQAVVIRDLPYYLFYLLAGRLTLQLRPPTLALLLKLLKGGLNAALGLANHHRFVLREYIILEVDSDRLTLTQPDLPLLVVDFVEVTDD